MATRRILHVDMDAFFASVEQHDDPALRGRPVLVGSPERRGVVAAASYEARAYGCRSAQPMPVARRLCPHAVVVPPRGPRYAEVSDRVFAVLEDEAPVVEPLSIDEAFLDLTGTERLLGDAVAVARRLRRRILDTTGLTASVGVAENKFLAKLASDLDKPDGLTVLLGPEVDRVLPSLPIERMWGVGPKAAERLRAQGIRSFADLRMRDVADLRRLLGAWGEQIHRLAHGIDDRPVTPPGEAKSLGREQTFPEDLEAPEAVRAVLLRQAEDVAARLRRHGLVARRVTVKIRYGAFETVTRSATRPEATDLTQEVWEDASALFDRWARGGFRPVRLVGVTAGDLAPAGSDPRLFEAPERTVQRRLDAAVDAIRERFGAGSILRARGAPAPGTDADEDAGG